MPAAFSTGKDYDEVKHYGNVSKINGSQVEPVDIITFGSPCQDLSVAGKRAGIQDGERSNLFFEAVRIIKEMRDSTNGEYHKYAVWENVPGAFSSNKGWDFHAVLEAFCAVKDDTVSIPEPYDAKGTKLVWNKSGEIMGDNYSIAWRTLDAQYWGVPQRRKRIYLVADFGSQRAGEILFKPDSLRGNLPQGNEKGQGATADAVGSVDGSNGNGGQLAATLISSYGTKWNGNAGAYNGENFVLQKHSVDGSVGVECLNPWDAQSIRQYSANGVYPTLSNNATGGQNRQGVVYALQANGIDRADTADRHAVCYDARGNGDGERACYTMQRSDEYQACEVASTQSARQYKSATDLVVEKKRRYIIRRLTPTECARLQGFSDKWGHLAPYNPADAEFWEDVRKTHAEINGKKYKPTKNLKKWYEGLHTDSAEYKLWGNGIALPNARYVLHGIAKQGAKTLGSLFDGSGGFPLAGVLNGIEPVWASEVEPYPIAVTKSRFKEANNG